MIARDEAGRLEAQLLATLGEDSQNTARLLGRLEAVTRESGLGAHAALLLILTRLAFDEDEARRHWEAILAHRDTLAAALGRDPGVRVALLDYFTNLNRRQPEPTLIDLELCSSKSDVDALTGLNGDRRFRSAVQAELRRARRYGLETAVVVLDVDRFGALNARLGTLVGDRLLREVAMMLANGVRDIDVAGRPGEDEFALLLPETGRNGGLLVAERFRRRIESSFAQREAAGRPVELTVSAGVAAYPHDASTPEALLEHAAQALYRAKAAGRNATQLYHAERRRFLRFELEPGRFEIEVVAPPPHPGGRARNVSRSGVLFDSPERLELGELIEMRLVDRECDPSERPLRLRGVVVRLEELPATSAAPRVAVTPDRFEIGVAFDLDWDPAADDLLLFLERVQPRRAGGP
jgi:diguanylate cyclase (GGDEF)-like protein